MQCFSAFFRQYLRNFYRNSPEIYRTYPENLPKYHTLHFLKMVVVALLPAGRTEVEEEMEVGILHLRRRGRGQARGGSSSPTTVQPSDCSFQKMNESRGRRVSFQATYVHIPTYSSFEILDFAKE